MPICLAAFKLMMNSNFLGCSTGKICRLSPFENFVDVRCCSPVQVVNTHSVRHETTSFHGFSSAVHYWEPTLYRELCNFLSLRTRNGAGHLHKNRASPLFHRGSESGLKILEA